MTRDLPLSCVERKMPTLDQLRTLDRNLGPIVPARALGVAAGLLSAEQMLAHVKAATS